MSQMPKIMLMPLAPKARGVRVGVVGSIVILPFEPLRFLRFDNFTGSAPFPAVLPPANPAPENTQARPRSYLPGSKPQVEAGEAGNPKSEIRSSKPETNPKIK